MENLIKQIQKYKSDFKKNNTADKHGYYLGKIRAINDILKIIKKYEN